MYSHKAHEHHPHNTEHVEIPADRVELCPVSGDAIDTAKAEKLGHFADVDDKRVYFCCDSCVKLFHKNPGQYTDHGHKHHHTPTTDTLRLKEKEHLTNNVWAFRFTAHQPLSWTAGQFIRIEIPHDVPDKEGTKRWFTISSTPHDGFVQVTTRVTDTTFKQTLAKLNVGDEVLLIEQPGGNFIWKESIKPLVFIAGGIGIAPFYSMLKARGHSKKPVSALLIYGGRTDELPFKEDLNDASRRHPEFSVVYVIGEPITAKKVIEVVPNLSSSQIYISGPQQMTESLRKQLVRLGLPKDDLHCDFFPNYNENNY